MTLKIQNDDLDHDFKVGKFEKSEFDEVNVTKTEHSFQKKTAEQVFLPTQNNPVHFL